jgi:hypothetical protein
VLPRQLRPLEPTLDDGDVLLRLNGQHIDNLQTLQKVVANLDNATPIRARVLRDGAEQDIELPALGPDMPGSNQLPPGARQRLTAAVERGALHPDRARDIANFYQPRDPGAEPTMRYGDVMAISHDSITIALFESGHLWTVPITERSHVYPDDFETSDVKVGDFVAVIRDPEGSVRWIYVLSVPYPPAP